MDDVFTPDYFQTRTSTIANAIEAEASVDPATPDAFQRHPANHHGELGRFSQHVEGLLDFVQLSYAFLDRAIDPVDGDPDTATVETAGVQPGDRLMFTDARGFSIGWLDVTSLTLRCRPSLHPGHRPRPRRSSRLDIALGHHQFERGS